MTDDPIRPIEEQLIRSAQQRRSQATDPFELHPATRNLLHAEVARTYPHSASTSQPRRPWLSSVWTRFALATSAAAILLLAILKVVERPHHQPELQFARFEEAPTAAETRSLDAVAPVRPTADPIPLSRAAEPAPVATFPELAKATHDSYGLAESLRTEAPIPPAELRPQQPPTSTPARSVTRRLAHADLSDLPTAPPEPRTEEFQPSIAAAPEPDFSAPLQSLPFAQIQRERVNLQSPPLPDVLRSFQFLQYHDTVRIVDADGSIYEGPLQPARPPDPTRFVATGTNRTTQHRVVFEGALQQTLDPLRDISTATTLGVTTATTLQQAPSTERFSAVPHTQEPASTPVQIVGQATLNDHTRFEIRAVRSGTP